MPPIETSLGVLETSGVMPHIPPQLRASLDVSETSNVPLRQSRAVGFDHGLPCRVRNMARGTQ